jgi:molybdenum cofactor cytidylyltransferase
MNSVTAIILAAGQSRRMGRAKVLLPWGKQSVLGQIVASLTAGGLDDIAVITGAEREAVEAEVRRLSGEFPVRSVFNSNYLAGDMFSSIQTGLAAAPPPAEAALIALGDQPKLEPETVRKVLGAYANSLGPLIVPSFDYRRGHPWLVRRELWPELTAPHGRETARDFLQRHAHLIEYVTVQTPSILQDIDTPEDYERERPE